MARFPVRLKGRTRRAASKIVNADRVVATPSTLFPSHPADAASQIVLQDRSDRLSHTKRVANIPRQVTEWWSQEGRWSGRRPNVRGMTIDGFVFPYSFFIVTQLNPPRCDHLHGRGSGKSKGSKQPCSIWEWNATGDGRKIQVRRAAVGWLFRGKQKESQLISQPRDGGKYTLYVRINMLHKSNPTRTFEATVTIGTFRHMIAQWTLHEARHRLFITTLASLPSSKVLHTKPFAGYPVLSIDYSKVIWARNNHQGC